MVIRKRQNEVRIRMNDEEFAIYQKRLAQAGTTGNEFGIKALLNIPVFSIPDMPELIRQLKALGNNLNQITRAVNFKEQPHAEVVREVKKGVDEVWQLLRHSKEGGR